MNNQNHEIIDGEIVEESPPKSPRASINNYIIMILNQKSSAELGKAVGSIVNGLAMLAFLALAGMGLTLQKSEATGRTAPPTINEGLIAAQQNDPNTAREIFLSLQNINDGCQSKLAEALASATEEAKSLDEFQQLADQPLQEASQQGCIRFRK
jgi:hypothetical protein